MYSAAARMDRSSVARLARTPGYTKARASPVTQTPGLANAASDARSDGVASLGTMLGTLGMRLFIVNAQTFCDGRLCNTVYVCLP